LQELSARASSAALDTFADKDVPDVRTSLFHLSKVHARACLLTVMGHDVQVILDLVRAYMCKSAQINVFGSFKDFYTPLTPPRSDGAGPHKPLSTFPSNPALLQQPPKTSIVRTMQRYGVDSQLDGESLWYFRNGKVECQEHYQLDQLHGVQAPPHPYCLRAPI
jgi:hypothetical protein